MDSLLQDIRVASRALVARPGFAAIAVLTLALGMGATTALFTIVHGVLLRPLPYPEPGRIVALWQTSRDNPQPSVGGTVPHLNFLDWQRQARSFEAMALYSPANFNVTGLGDAEIVPGGIVTADFFQVFASPPIAGRGFTRDEDRPGGPEVIVIGHGFWKERLGGRPDAVGSTLEISGRNWQIVGIAPPGFDFPNDARIWQPVRNDDSECGRRCVYLDGVGRLAAGVSVDAAREEMRAIAERLEREYPDANTNVTAAVARLQDQIVGDVRRALILLLGAVGMVLLIACANVANLLLVRGTARQNEIAVRAALGAGRARLVRFLLTESAVLAAGGTIAGLFLGWWGVDLLKQFAPANIPRLDEVAFDATTFLFAVGIGGLTALLFGLGPAVSVINRPLMALLGARGEAGGRGTRWSRTALLVAEVALSLMLLAGAGLMLRSMARLQSIDPGWRSDDIAVFTTGLPSSRYPDAAAVVRGFEELDERLGAMPGVEAVARISGLPLGPSINVLAFSRTDRPAPAPGQVPNALYRAIDGDYFQAVRIPLLAGRNFEAQDRDAAQPVVIISREMADRFWPGEDPLGRQIRIGDTTRTIVGIVAGVRSTSLAEPPEPEMYVPHAQSGTRSATFVLRSRLPAGQVLTASRAVVRGFDRRLPVFQPRAFADLEAQAMARPRFYLLLFGLFATLAATLAAVGIYGVVAFVVTQRRREIGVRLALGADRTEVLRLILWQGLRPTIVGMALGLAGALAGGRLLSGLLYDIAPRDPVTMAGVVVMLIGVALLACAVPAWRATNVPPAAALRME